MPTAPTLQPQIKPEALPRARRSATLTPLAAGVGLAQAQEQLGATIANAGLQTAAGVTRLAAAQAEQAEKARQQANKLQAIKLQNQVDAWTLEHVYKPRTGYLAQEGENALALPETAQKELMDLWGELEPQVMNDEQRLAYEGIKSNTSDRVMLEVFRHTDAQARAVMQSELESAERLTVSKAAAHANDPVAVRQDLDNGLGAIDALKKETGLGTTATELRKATLRSNVHLAVISNLLASGTAEGNAKARAYYEETRDEVDGEKRDEVERMLRGASVKQESQQHRDAIVAAGGTLQEQRDKAKAIKDPDVQEATLAMIEHEHAIAKQVKTESEEEINKQIANILDKNPRIDAVPTRLWLTQTGPERNAWRGYIDNVIQAGSTGGTGFAKHSDAKTYSRLLDMALNDPEAFATVKLVDPSIMRLLTKDDWEGLMKGRASAAKSDTKALNAELRGPFTFLQVFNAEVGAAGIKEHDPIIPKLQQAVATDVQLAQAALPKGQVLDADTVRAIVRKGLLSSMTSDNWGPFNTYKRGAELEISDVPAVMLKQIKDALAVTGQPPTEQNILSTYRSYLAEKAKAK